MVGFFGCYLGDGMDDCGCDCDGDCDGDCVGDCVGDRDFSAFFFDASLTFARYFSAVSKPPRNSSNGEDVNGADRVPSSSSSIEFSDDVDNDGLMVAAWISNN